VCTGLRLSSACSAAHAARCSSLEPDGACRTSCLPASYLVRSATGSAPHTPLARLQHRDKMPAACRSSVQLPRKRRLMHVRPAVFNMMYRSGSKPSECSRTRVSGFSGGWKGNPPSNKQSSPDRLQAGRASKGDQHRAHLPLHHLRAQARVANECMQGHSVLSKARCRSSPATSHTSATCCNRGLHDLPPTYNTSF
jgi:hypothetical protein